MTDALRILESSYGSDHEQIADALVRLGWIKMTNRDAKDALKNLVRAAKIREQHFAKDSWQVAEVKNLVAWALAMLGQSQKSQVVLNTYYPFFKKEYRKFWNEDPPEKPDFELMRMFFITMRKGEELDTLDALNAADKSSSSKIGCFVATVTYGTHNLRQLDKLRYFRDNRLCKTSSGRYFIRMYYKYGPSLAKIVDKSYFAKNITKTVLDFIVRFI